MSVAEIPAAQDFSIVVVGGLRDPYNDRVVVITTRLADAQGLRPHERMRTASPATSGTLINMIVTARSQNSR
jgi:hypothetical protein